MLARDDASVICGGVAGAQSCRGGNPTTVYYELRVVMSEEKQGFADLMDDVVPLRSAKKIAAKPVATRDASLALRRQAALELAEQDNGFLSTEYAPPLGPHDIISFVRPGVQHGVFHKLRRGRYEPEATLDLHRASVEQARLDLWDFLRQSTNYQLRTVMVLHGKGDRAPKPAVLKSFVAQWLKEIPQVLAYYSALPNQGGAGALYVLLKKSPRASEDNRERHFRRRPHEFSGR